MAKENLMKKVISIITLLVLIPSAFAWFPDETQLGYYLIYGELCLEENPDTKWWHWFYNPEFKKKCTSSELKDIINCNIENPKDYNCQMDIQRQCTRNCLKYNITFQHFTTNIFCSNECWCTADDDVIFTGRPRRIY